MDDKLRDDELVCRCEEVTVGDIRAAIKAGARDVTEIKLRTRAGMGLCQGRTCEFLVQQILSRELGISADKTSYSTPRTPQRPVTFGTLGGDGFDE